MTRWLATVAALASVLLVAGCQMEFSRARPDATPFGVADDECWDYAGSAPRGDEPAYYTTCMKRHGWASCDPERPCRSDAL